MPWVKSSRVALAFVLIFHAFPRFTSCATRGLITLLEVRGVFRPRIPKDHLRDSWQDSRGRRLGRGEEHYLGSERA